MAAKVTKADACARDIVLMLMRRKKAATRRLIAHQKTASTHRMSVDTWVYIESQLLCTWIEIHNSTEFARRILYGIPR